MSEVRYRPKRSFRSELPPLATVLSLPLALYLAFPSGAVGFRPVSAVPESGIRRAFITLSPEREAKLLASARAAWQSDAASRRGDRANLLACDFDRAIAVTASGVSPSAAVTAAAVAGYDPPLLPSVSAAASAPERLAPVELKEKPPAFAKSDLLKLD